MKFSARFACFHRPGSWPTPTLAPLAAAVFGWWILAPSAEAAFAVKPLVAFYGTNGASPFASLSLGTDGNFYGTTFQGGTSSNGTVFKVTQTGALTTLISFNQTNGAKPMAPLLQGADGNWYGTTSAGGSPADGGTVFVTTPSGILTTLSVFGGTNGAEPQGQLVQNTTNGNIYGTTRSGGTNGLGTVFITEPPGWLTTLLQFNSLNAVNPVSGLILGSDGNFYGTSAGTSTNPIPIFSLTPYGTLSILTNLDSTNGVLSALTQTSGSFYGATSFGGSNGLGSIFMLSPSGNWTNLVSFDASNGAVPIGGLVQGSDGNLYGTTSAGGDYGFGTVFVMSPGGAFTNLFSFAGTNGAVPLAALFQGTNGNFYGTTSAGGDNGLGTVFEITPSGIFTNLLSFPPSNPGQTLSPLLQFTNGNFVGTRTASSTNVSTIFQVTPSGVVTTLASFDPTNGVLRGVVQGLDGNFYGTTSAGGIYNQGAIFLLTAAGVLTNFISFNATNNGAEPVAGLVVGTNGNLYGTTLAGGTNGFGIMFMSTLVTNPVITTLFAFSGTNVGAAPIGGLVQGSDGYIYGAASAGGNISAAGTLFRFPPVTTNLTPIYAFSGPDGAGPQAPLVPGLNGLFYGTTFAGGTNNVSQGGDGTFFSVLSSGAFTNLLSFGSTNVNGIGPFGALVQGVDGNFYGTTTGGGSHNRGTIFSVSASGAFTLLHSFTGGSDGSVPYGGLAQGTDGNFYGVTFSGGQGGQGTIYQLSGFSPIILTQPTNQTVPTGTTVTLAVRAGGSAPLTYQWLFNTNGLKNGHGFSGVTSSALTLSNVAPANSGAYNVLVRNQAGSATSTVATLSVVDPYGAGRPRISIQSPAQEAYLRSALVSVTGTASATVAVLRVYYQLNGTGWQSLLANHPSTSFRWATPLLSLLPGTNAFEAYAVSIANQYSATNTALFVPSPYASVAGNYNGLFYDSNAVTLTNAGFFSLAVTYLGKYSGSLQLAGNRYSLTGQFNTKGTASATVPRPGQEALSVQMDLDLSGGSDQITGVITNSAWAAPLSGYRAVFDARLNPAPLAGQYTLVIPGSDSNDEPFGDSYGTVTVDKGGNLRLSATLADGTRFTQAVPISENGRWPMNAPIYSGQGLVLGWITFPANPQTDFVSWIKPALPKAQLFPGGFALSSSSSTSRYAALGNGTNWLGATNSTNLTLVLIASNSAQGITNQITIDKNNRVSSAGDDQLNMTFSASAGTFRGTFLVTPSSKPVSFNGVVLQNGPSGRGFFLGTNQSGRVFFGP